jgi:peptidoglycan hydrolase-like protein with peptidoglycan-binding domain
MGVAAVAGALVAITVRGSTTVAVSAAPPRLATATVTRTDLSASVLTEGTAGYAPSAPVVNQQSGTYTELPPAGAVVAAGQVLYRVDNGPVVLMTGNTPAWRPFGPGMGDGPDVSELQASLLALGDADGLLTAPTGHFDAATQAAVERWQRSEQLTPDGQIPLGGVAFLPGPVLVGAPNAALGDLAAPGATPYAVTTSSRVVTVPLNADLPTVTVGEQVAIVLPSNSHTPGTVTGIGPAPSSGPSSGGGGSGSGGSSSGGSPSTVVATVSPVHPAATGAAAGEPVQVSLTSQTAPHVLAVPIASLLALAGGGYGVEVVQPSGAHHLVGVTTGLFTGSKVAITGSGIRAGDKVVVAQ